VKERDALHHAAKQQLAAVARLKAADVSSWISERLGDASLLASSPVLWGGGLDARPEAPAGAREAIHAVLETAVRTRRYESVELLDPSGRVVVSAGSADVHPPEVKALLQARASTTTSAVPSGLYRDEAGKIHLDVGVAVRGPGGSLLGTVVLHIDPEAFLLPLIEKWPISSRTAESLLVRREQDGVLYLNHVRHDAREPLTFTIPLTRTEVVAVRAVTGQTGIVEGIDYRGAEVLCAVEPIEPTGWILIAKMDREEVDAPLRQRVWLLAIAGTALGLVTTASLRSVWRRRLAVLNRESDRSRRLLERAIEQSADAIVITDLTSTITYVNPAFERITGYAAAEVVGQNPRILKSGEHDEAFYRALYATLLSGGTFRGRMTNRRKDGSFFEEDATISPVRGPAGELVAFVAVKRDVTREREMEERLRQSAKVEAVGQLAGGVAHDFNNLLTVISGFAALAKDELPAGHAAAGHLDEVLGAGERAAQLTRQLLAFSRRQVLRPDVVDLSAAVTEASGMLRRLIGEDIRVELDLAPDLRPVLVDPTQMHQVILNLAINARDAMPGGGTLTFETANVVLDEAYAASHESARTGPHVMLTVSDTGAGIPHEIQAKVFDPFFTTKEKGKGTGLGLSTVYGIIKQSEGWIWLYSEVGKGTTFRIYLPPAPTNAPRTGPVAVVTGERKAAGRVLLVVEDEPALVGLVTGFLASEGFTVRSASGPDEALEVARRREGPIHAVLTDVVMPGMSGPELVRRLRAEREIGPVLFMSGYTANAIAHHGVLEPGVALLEKPFTREALLERVWRLFEEQPAPYDPPMEPRP